MDAAVSTGNGGDWETAARLFAELEADIDEPFDPQRYGWVHFYRFKAAYMTRDYEAAWALLEKPRLVAAMTARNAAWMSSVGAEVAARLGRPDDVVAQAERCIDIRRQMGDEGGVAMSARTACALLEQIGEDHRNRPFAALLIEAGEVYGYRALARSVAVNPNPLDIDELIAARDALAEIDDDHAREVVAFVDRSDEVAARRAALPVAEAMWNAGLAGDVAELERLIAGGADPDAPWTQGRNALQGASLAGHLAAVEALLGAGAGVDRRTSQGRGPLHFAADENHAAIASALLARGADPNRRDMFGQTPLHLCGWQGHVEVARVLLEGGADVDARDVNGATPLSLAVTEDVPAIVDLFVDAGVAVDQLQGMGWTPLMCAANAGQVEVVKRLLARGADPTVADEHGRTAASLAAEEGHPEVAGLVRP